MFTRVTSITESFQKMFKMKRIHEVSNLLIYDTHKFCLLYTSDAADE